MMAEQIRKGTEVTWSWGNGTGRGKVAEVFTEKVTRMIKGAEVFTEKVTRMIKGAEIAKNGSEDCPAYLIEQDDGSRVLKLRSEVERA